MTLPSVPEPAGRCAAPDCSPRVGEQKVGRPRPVRRAWRSTTSPRRSSLIRYDICSGTLITASNSVGPLDPCAMSSPSRSVLAFVYPVIARNPSSRYPFGPMIARSCRNPARRHCTWSAGCGQLRDAPPGTSRSRRCQALGCVAWKTPFATARDPAPPGSVGTPVLHLHRAERSDPLADALADVLAEPPADPFTAEVVAVPARGMERWLAHRLAHRLGTAAGRGAGGCGHVAFPPPGDVVAAALDGASGVATADDPWQPARAVWPLMEVVDSCTGRPWCAPLAAHLDRARSRFAVIAHLAGLFAAYATHRPELLDAWRAGDDTEVPDDLRWQPELWRALRARIDAPDPAERLPPPGAGGGHGPPPPPPP